MKTVIATSFEILGARQAQLWNRFSDLLEKRGTLLYLLTTNVHPELKGRFIVIPYRLQDFNTLNVTSAVSPHQLARLLARETRWVGGEITTSIVQGAARCQQFYRELFEILVPDLVLLWNTLLPQSQVARMACDEQAIPVCALERGLLPGTWLCDTKNNVADSELEHSWAQCVAERNYCANEALVNRYRDWYVQHRPVKYDAKKGEGFEQLRHQGEAVTLVLGQAQGTGVPLSDNLPVACDCNPFETVEAAIASVRAATKNTVVFRDHPINLEIGAKTVLPPGVTALQEGTLVDCLELASEVVSFGFTTGLYEALLLEKPVLVIGGSPLSRMAPYYNVIDGNVAEAMHKMQTGGYSAIREKAVRALSYALERYLIGVDDGVPAGSRLEDFADYVAGFRRPFQLEPGPRMLRLETWAKSL